MRIKKELLEKAIEIQTITVEAFEKPGISAPEMERVLLECLLELKEYRDAEEKGLSPKLPCKLGDAVYLVDFEEREIDEGTVSAIHIDSDGVSIDSDYEIFSDVSANYVFFDKAEAEKALGRLKFVGTDEKCFMDEFPEIKKFLESYEKVHQSWEVSVDGYECILYFHLRCEELPKYQYTAFGIYICAGLETPSFPKRVFVEPGIAEEIGTNCEFEVVDKEELNEFIGKILHSEKYNRVLKKLCELCKKE